MNWYDAVAKGYDELRGDEQRQKFAAFDDYIDEDMRVLDVGFGTGLSDDYFDADIIGVEPSQGMLDEYSGDATTYNAKAADLDELFQPNSFDSVLCVSTAHHFDEPKVILQRIASLLRPDGYILISVFKNTSQVTSLVTDRFDVVRTTTVVREKAIIAKMRYQHKVA